MREIKFRARLGGRSCGKTKTRKEFQSAGLKITINTPVGIPEDLHGHHQACALATWHNKGRPLTEVWSHKNEGVIYRYRRGKTLTIYIEAAG